MQQQLAQEPAFALRPKPDLILQLAYPYIEGLRKCYRSIDPQPVIVAGLNVGYSAASKEALYRTLCFADHIIINNRDCWEKCRKPKHKRYDEVLLPLAAKLNEAGIDHDFRVVNSFGGPTRWPASRMNDWYNTGSVYVCASKTEGTPNPALEAAAAGCVVASTPVGNMPELITDGVNGYLVTQPTAEAMLAAILQARDHYNEMAGNMLATIAGWDWKLRAPAYYDLFRRLLA
jgi:hypothetical protein